MKRVQIQTDTLSPKEKQYLTSLGLSNHEIKVYELLEHEAAPLSAHEIAEKLAVFPSAVYRNFYALERKGLVYRVSGSPIKYAALKKSKGFQVGLQTTKANLEGQVHNLMGSIGAEETETRVILGRKGLYDAYAELASKAKYDTSIYAIGIAYSKKLHNRQAGAQKRGVRIRHVVQQVKASNYHVIHKWQLLGVQLRHLKTDKGFHVMIVDDAVIVSFSNPEDIEERLSILTYNPAAVKLFRLLFEQIWRESRVIQ